jgi:hypothetical protein
VINLNGLIWDDSGTTENDEIVYYDQNDAYAIWYDGAAWLITIVADVGDTKGVDFTDYLTNTSLTGTYTGVGGWVTVTDVDVDGAYGGYPLWKNSTHHIRFEASFAPAWGSGSTADSWVIAQISGPTVKYVACNYLLPNVAQTTSVGAIGWQTNDGVAWEVEFTFSMVIGKTGPAFSEDNTVTINSSEQKFVSDGGLIADPVGGEIKSIQNVPMANGTFKTTVTTKTALSQRLPALYDMLSYNNGKPIGASDPSFKSGILIGKNRTDSELIADLDVLSSAGTSALNHPDRYTSSNSVSVSINSYGRYDYTMLSSYR